jgi:hypothetical protein
VDTRRFGEGGTVRPAKLDLNASDVGDVSVLGGSVGRAWGERSLHSTRMGVAPPDVEVSHVVFTGDARRQ